MSEGGTTRPVIKAVDYGLPMGCQTPGCDYRWLKLPGLRVHACPNCGGSLVRLRPRGRGKDRDG